MKCYIRNTVRFYEVSVLSFGMFRWLKLVLARLFVVFCVCISVCSVADSEPQAQNPIVEGDTHVSATPRTESPFVLDLLNRADQALKEGKGIKPLHNNAYDLYQSVLLLSKNNTQAQSGLQAILVGLANDVRSLVSAKRLSSARKQVRVIEKYFPSSILVDELSALIRETQRQMPKPKIVSEPKTQYEELALSAPALKARSPELISQLHLVANRLAKSDESVMIFARTDKEGRWIYKQLKNGAKGYRIRGDIRIGRPRLRFLPPLE